MYTCGETGAAIAASVLVSVSWTQHGKACRHVFVSCLHDAGAICFCNNDHDGCGSTVLDTSP